MQTLNRAKKKEDAARQSNKEELLSVWCRHRFGKSKEEDEGGGYRLHEIIEKKIKRPKGGDQIFIGRMLLKGDNEGGAVPG